MDKEKLKKLRRSDFFKAVFLIIFVFVTGWVIFGFTRVYGSAMKPAACDGDILMYYRLHTEYKAGDMVVYQADGLLHIGRIAAVPEETVQITDEGELVQKYFMKKDLQMVRKNNRLEKGNIIFWRMILPQRRTAEVMDRSCGSRSKALWLR